MLTYAGSSGGTDVYYYGSTASFTDYVEVKDVQTGYDSGPILDNHAGPVGEELELGTTPGEIDAGDQLVFCEYTGCFSYLARFPAFWRRNNKPLRTRAKMISTEAILTSSPLESCSHQISPRVASALLCKLRTQMSQTRRLIVDTLKSNCPGFATMRGLVMGFRTILRIGTIKSLHLWMNQAQSSGIHGMRRFVRRLR